MSLCIDSSIRIDRRGRMTSEEIIDLLTEFDLDHVTTSSEEEEEMVIEEMIGAKYVEPLTLLPPSRCVVTTPTSSLKWRLYNDIMVKADNMPTEFRVETHYHNNRIVFVFYVSKGGKRYYVETRTFHSGLSLMWLSESSAPHNFGNSDAMEKDARMFFIERSAMHGGHGYYISPLSNPGAAVTVSRSRILSIEPRGRASYMWNIRTL